MDRSVKITLPVLIEKMDSIRKQNIPPSEIIAHLININNGNPISTQRFFAGKNYDNEVGLFIKDE